MEILFVQIFAKLQTQFLPSNLTTKQNGIIHTKSNSWQTWWFLLKFATEIQFWDEQLLHWQGPLSRGLNEAEAHRATDTSNRWSFEKLGIEAMTKTELPEPKSVWRARKPWTFEDSRARRSTENSEKCCCGDENVQKECKCIRYMICWIFCAVYRDGGMPRSSHSCILRKTCLRAHLGILGNTATLLTFRSFHEMPAPDSAKCMSQLLRHCFNTQDWRYLDTHRCFAPRQHVVILWPGSLLMSFDCPGGVAWCYKHCCTLYILVQFGRK